MCGLAKPIYDDGKCRYCYADWIVTTGRSETELPPRCTVANCDRFAEKKGMCDRHYRRVADHGHSDKIRQQGPSELRQHPYFKNWEYLKRNNVLCDEWNDFRSFIRHVGERPTEYHKAYRPRKNELYGPDNFEWVLSRSKNFAAHYVEFKPSREKSVLNRFYGMSQQQYDTLLAEQGGKCAVCDKNTDVYGKATEVNQSLSVDHDHSTGEIRGLLCRKHNFALGQLDDNPDIIRKLLEYVTKPNHTGWFVPEKNYYVKGTPAAYRKPNTKNKNCSVNGCYNPVKAKNLCSSHYAQKRITGSTTVPVRLRPSCCVDGCNEISVAKLMCRPHYNADYQKRLSEKKRSEKTSFKNLTVSSLVCDNPTHNSVNIRGDTVPKERLYPLGVNNA
jgi:hypothetical protein